MNATRTFVCSHCHHTWQCPYGTGRPAECPACRQQDFHRTAAERGRGRGPRHGRHGQPGGLCGQLRKGARTQSARATATQTSDDQPQP